MREDEKDAAVRLSLIHTQAVGIVDRAANGELFLALKNMDGQTNSPAAPTADTTKAPDATAPVAGPIKLPGAAKASLVSALALLLGHITDAAELVQNAEVDETAPAMPADLLAHMIAADDALDDALGPYDYDDEQMAAPPGASMPPPGADPSQKAAPPPAQGAAPPPPADPGALPKKPKPRLALKRLAEMASVHKALDAACQKLGEHIAWAQGPGMGVAPAGTMAPAKKGLDPYTELHATADAVKERMYCIRDLLESDPAKVAAELRGLIPMVDNLAALVTQARTGAMAEQAPAGAPPAPTTMAAPPAAPTMDVETVQKALTASLTSLKGEVLTSLRGELSELTLAAKTAAARAQTALTKVEKSVSAPNAQPAGETPAPTMGAPSPADPWREAQKEIQETSQARRSAAGK